MSTLLITDNSMVGNIKWIEVTDMKKTARIMIDCAGLMVCQTSNSSHKVYGGFGKRFASFEDAIAGYKSSFMRDAIALAQTL